MRDPRMDKLADVLVGYSCGVKPGEKVLVEAFDMPEEMVCAITERVVIAGGLPFVVSIDTKIRRTLLMSATEEQMKIMEEADMTLMKHMDCYIGIRGGSNYFENSDVPAEKMNLARQFWQKSVLDQRLNHTRWVILRWPSPALAQMARMSTDQFEEFYFNVCTLDYAKMAEAENSLKTRMESADKVRILGPYETDISFSIKGMPSMPCVGDRNLPDGELYSAPIKNSVNGVIRFNAGSSYYGKPFDDIYFVFKDGRITEAACSDTRALLRILDTDDGARYIGEFAFGFNPYVTRVMRDSLFDEKISGSIHLAIGSSYMDVDNGNRSRIRWGLPLIQTPEYGGGEIWFDNELIRKDGLFIPDYLQCLNPENLI
jgi:aminopeptidase